MTNVSQIAGLIAGQIGQRAMSMMGVHGERSDGQSLTFGVMGSVWDRVEITANDDQLFSVSLRLRSNPTQVKRITGVSSLHRVLAAETQLFPSFF